MVYLPVKSGRLKEIEDVMGEYADLIRAAMKSRGMTQADVGQAVGVRQTTIGNALRGDTKAPRKWKEIAEAVGVSAKDARDAVVADSHQPGARTRMPANLGRSHTPQPAAATAVATRRIPVQGRAVGGADGEYLFNGQTIDYVPCPPQFQDVEGLYAIFADGESMEPGIQAGETLIVHPHMPPRRGNDVVIQVQAEDAQEGDVPRGFVKRFVRYTSDELIVEQFNPAKEIKYYAGDVVSVHTVVARYA